MKKKNLDTKGLPKRKMCMAVSFKFYKTNNPTVYKLS